MNRIGQILQRLRIDERWMLMSFLIVAVAVPTIFFLFFLRRSLLSETELARSTTTTAFLTTLGQTQEAMARYLSDHEALQLPRSMLNLSPGEKFTRAIGREATDSLILLDESGQPSFPIMPRARSASHLTEADRQALEIREELHASLNPTHQMDTPHRWHDRSGERARHIGPAHRSWPSGSGTPFRNTGRPRASAASDQSLHVAA
jgi:hypothetical protein